jgi:PAS domain S-box-containing protein
MRNPAGAAGLQSGFITSSDMLISTSELSALQAENAELRLRLAAAEQALQTLRSKPVDEASSLAAPQLAQSRKRTRQPLQALTLVDTLLRHAPVGFAFIDRELRYVHINECLADINGQPAAAHIGRTVAEIVPSLADATRAVVQRIEQTGEPVKDHEFSGETSLAPGVMRYWKTSWYPVRRSGASKEIFGFGIVVEEITARRQAENSLRLERDRLGLALTHGQMGFYELNLSTDSITWSPETYRLFGVEQTSFVPSRVALDALVHPGDRAYFWQYLDETIAAHQPFVHEFRIVRPDGMTCWLHNRANTIYDTAGQPTSHFGVVMDITERKTTELALHDSQHFLQRLTEVTPDVLHVFDLVKRHPVFVNRSVAATLGYAPGDIEAMGSNAVARLMHPDDRPAFEQHLIRLRDANDGEVIDFEHRMCDQPGNWHWFHSRDAVFTRNAEGEVQQIIGIATDITARRRLDDELRLTVQRFELSLRGSKVMVSNQDLDLRYTWIYNPVFGFDTLAPLGKTDAQLCERASDADVLIAFKRRVIESGHSEETNIVIRNAGVDRSYLVLADPLHDSNQCIVGVTCAAIETTERVHAEKRVQLTNQKLQAVLGSISEGLLMLDNNWCYTYFNDQGARLLGIEPSELIGRCVWELFPEVLGTTFEKSYRRAVETGEAVHFDEYYEAPVNRWIECHCYPSDEGLSVYFHDITERKNAEEDLRRLAGELAEANQRKNEFLATLAHELRNPLAPIRNGLRLLKQSPDANRPDPQDHSEHNDSGRGSTRANAALSIHLMMERQLTHLVRLVDDLMDVSRISTGKLHLKKECVDLASVLHSAIESSHASIEQSRQTLTVALPSEPAWVDADPTRLAQVFLNLLNNAARYGVAGGQIALAVTAEGGELIVSVKDTGIGIPADMLTSIFGLFSQVDRSIEKLQGGLGIGLSLVKRLVLMHGGTVQARSDGLGCGSEFIVRLPRAQPAVQTEAPVITPRVDAQPAAPRRIMIADDNEDAAGSLAILLEMLGYEVETVKDGLQAVETSERFRPHVALLDIGMPGLNGHEACRQIRAQSWSGGAQLIALTGWGQDEDRRRSREAGFDHHLVKPVDPAMLEALLASFE